jgi:hypothetical protein
MLIDGCVPPTTYTPDDGAGKKNDSSKQQHYHGSSTGGYGAGAGSGSVWQEMWALLKRAVHPPQKPRHGTTRAVGDDGSVEDDTWQWAWEEEHDGRAGAGAAPAATARRQSRQLRLAAGQPAQQQQHLQQGLIGDSASTANSENPDGTVCCLYAVVMATGKVSGGGDQSWLCQLGLRCLWWHGGMM